MLGRRGVSIADPYVPGWVAINAIVNGKRYVLFSCVGEDYSSSGTEPRIMCLLLREIIR